MPTHWISRDDTLTKLHAQLMQRDAEGFEKPADLSGKAVQFKMIDDAGTLIVDYVEAVVEQANTGLVSYDFQPTDVATPGVYWGWFRVSSGGEYDTYPAKGRELRIVIEDRN